MTQASEADVESQSVSAKGRSHSGMQVFNAIARITMFQLLVMLKRNFTLLLRYKRSSIAQAFLAPIIFILLLYILQSLDKSRLSKETLNPHTYPLSGVQRCQGSSKSAPCVTIMYTPDTPLTRIIMQTFDEKNAERTGSKLSLYDSVWTDVNQLPTTQMGIVPLPSTSTAIYDYVIQNPNTTAFGVSFTSSFPDFSYQLWFNTTQTTNETDSFAVQLHPFQRGLDEAIISVANTDEAVNNPTAWGNVATNNATLNARLRDWPTVAPGALPDTIVSNLGAIFFFCSVMVIFISVLQSVVTEKELRLRHAMETIGLRAAIYWFSTFISTAVLVLIASLVTCIMGVICNFTIFTQSSFSITFLTFFLFGLAMVSFAFFLTTFCRRARVAVLLGMFIFVIGLIFQSFIFSSAYVGYLWWDDGTDPGARRFFYLLPFFNFGKFFLDLNLYTTGKFDTVTGTSKAGNGFHWADLYQAVPQEYLPQYSSTRPKSIVPAPVESWGMLIMNIFLYGFLAWYLDKVIPDEYGRRYPAWFFIQPRFWQLNIGKQFSLTEYLEANKKLSNQPKYQCPDEDIDVTAERTKAFDSGQNGAGKSTTMSCLSGLTPPSGGNAVFFGRTIVDDMDAIRNSMGICPQHDILFDDLTPVEHLELYGGLKNLSREEISKIAKERLEAVRLWKVKDQVAGTFSGGMKRRLSVVISTIGDPNIVFLDEPTTGMDPVNRRHVWTFLEKFKKGRIMVLTTHSMEEADILGDQIAMMAKGQIRALGSSMRLKARFGAGYRIGLTTEHINTDAAKNLVMSHIAEAELEDDSAGSLIYRVPAAQAGKLPDFIRIIESEEGSKLVQSWGLSQTTLEEIFLKLIRAIKE